jgi:hypothetical protein
MLLCSTSLASNDVEIVFLYPLVVSLYHISYFGFWIAMVFILLLAIGFIYELGKGALDYAKDSSSSKNCPAPGPLGAKGPLGALSPRGPGSKG